MMEFTKFIFHPREDNGMILSLFGFLRNVNK